MTIRAMTANGSILKQEIFRDDVTPHWKPPGNVGHFSLRLTGSTREKWLDLDTRESAETSSRRTMLTLREDEVRALRNLCNTILEESA